MKVLLSAYSCEPGTGSEPGVGWNVVRELASHHEVWALTGTQHASVIAAELTRNPIPNLRFVHYELPRWARWLDRGGPREHLWEYFYYYLWQLGVYRTAKRLHREVGIDLAQHLTFAVYWKPSMLALLPVPFVWGPVGGGESAPKAFRGDFSPRGRVYELVRDLARWLGEHDPFVRATARRSALALASTEETAGRMRKLGARNVHLLSQTGLGEEELERLNQHGTRVSDGVRFVSVGRLLHWKGFHLGLRAFAESSLTDAEYWILGDGPERRSLQLLAEELGIAHRVKFWGKLPREDVLSRMGECQVLVHPSLHESGGLVCVEAMGARCPVVCLDLGGPSGLVTGGSGFRIPAINPEQAVSDLAEAMRRLGKDQNLRTRASEAAYERAKHFSWRKQGTRIAELYQEVKEVQI